MSLHPHSPTQAPHQESQSPSDLIQVFNTALLSSKAASHDYLSELCHVLDTPAFRAIISSIRALSKNEGLSEKDAAEAVIKTFRKLDTLWGDYVFQQGLTQLKSQMAQSERNGPLGSQAKAQN